MGERNVDLSAYVPPDVKGDKGNVGSTGGQVQVELEDEDDHFSAPGAKQATSYRSEASCSDDTCCSSKAEILQSDELRQLSGRDEKIEWRTEQIAAGKNSE
ncbi:hypothetical protein Mgra_00003245 [Meloidogyne graminicola]|uniref:Uncharacterized protein n=1 Tax=Meloidogyne graminicola TaxID=189291 RepID=A0A8S9ZUL6_9BILA|nr:hypothetical protein Mgra_00003245 [Meloidogyne graminicola]